MNILTKSAKSKTMLFAYALAILGVVETQYRLVEAYIPEQYRGAVFMVIAGAVAALRVVTTQSLGDK